MIPKKAKKLRACRDTLIKKLDKIVGDIVKKRDGSCVTCPIWRTQRPNWKSSSILEPGHLFSRVAFSTRWSLSNVFCQCKSCNNMHEYDTYALTKYFIDKFGQEAYDKLHARYCQPVKFSDYDLEEMYTMLKEKLEQMEGGEIF